MNSKKFLATLVVLALLVSMLPTVVWAQSAAIPIEGPRVESPRSRSTSAVPSLSDGHHQSYLDRVALLPEYALDFYHWLEDNSGPDGMLVDPTKADEYEGDYYHSVHYVSGTEKFTFSSKDEILITGSALASAGLEKEFNSFNNWANTVLDIFDRDHPEVFWLSGNSSFSYMGSWSYSIRGNVCTIYYQADLVVWLKYPEFDIRQSRYQDPAAIVADMNARDELVREILAGCPDGSDYDRVVYLNDTLTTRNAYNSAVASGESSKADPIAWECISALVGNSGQIGPVCEGYARAFQVLCNELNIPCVLVNGIAKGFPGDEPEDHMWNYVQLDGGWYAIDVTWNDPYVTFMPEEKATGYECQDWLLLGSDTEIAQGMTFLESHVVDNCIRPGGLAYTNGPVLERDAYVPQTVTLYSIGGKVSSKGEGDVTVELLQDGTAVATQVRSGSSAEYFFEIAPGSYQLKVSKADHVTYTQALTVTDQAVTHDLKLRLSGDVTGDGRINVGDVARIYGHIRKTSVITDPYILLCADVTGDGRINVGDTARLYGRIRG